MPLYEYKCSKCEEVHELMQKFSDAPLETCPSCGGAVSKLMSLSSFALKGAGWYTTDYKRSSPPSSPSSKTCSSESSDTAKSPCGSAGVCAASPVKSE